MQRIVLPLASLGPPIVILGPLSTSEMLRAAGLGKMVDVGQ